MVDVDMPGESCISQKTVEKLTKYVDLKIEMSRPWRTKKVFVIPMIIDALGSVPIDLSNYLDLPDCSLTENCVVQNIINLKTILANLTCLLCFLYPPLLVRAI